jgi:nucleotide-binding universal stress UspA family protein
MIYKRILVAVDGSKTSSAGLAEALRIAKDQRATLGLLHVVDEMSIVSAPEAMMSAGVVIEALRDAGQRIMDRTVAAVRKARVKPETKIVEAIGTRVADIIVRHAKRWRADLIVMGTHGRRGVNRMFMGSDAELVVRTAPVPVLLVRAEARSRTARRR